jgi:hypothetical protein
MKQKKLIALFAGLSLAFVGSAALAAPSADTLLVAGYDSDQMAVLYGVSGIDQEGDDATLDCTLIGDFVYELDAEAPDDATEVEVTGLEKKGGEGEENSDVEFFAEDVEEPVAGEGVMYGTATDDEQGAEECTLASVKIEPKNGKINHGAVVSTFAHLLLGGNGCLIRHFAQSDFGKGEYGDGDGDGDGDTLEVTLDSIETSCAKGKDKVKDKDKDKDNIEDTVADDDSSSDDGESGKEKAPGQQKDKQKGKDSAPGQNKLKDDDSSSD